MDDGHDHSDPFHIHQDGDEMGLTNKQVSTLIILERAGAGLSIVGITLIFVTYAAFKKLRTVPNLFILFASMANAGASAACLMGYDGIHKGANSALCQAQAFLLEMLMQSDPWWSFAMAVNVFLVFFLGANPSSFRKYLWVYCLVCFGAPFIPALALLLIKDESGARIYGDATLWCWIGSSWNHLRIYTYYMPIWICILFSTIIYIAVGYHVFHQRNQLRNLTFTQLTSNDKDVSQTDGRDSAERNLTKDPPDHYGTAVTEVQITMDSPQPWTPSTPKLPTKPPRVMASMETLDDQGPWTSRAEDLKSSEAMYPIPPPGNFQPRFETTCSSAPQPVDPNKRERKHKRKHSVWERFMYKLKKLDPVKLAYLRTSFIFAISVLVTWTPSSINRVHNLFHKDQPNFPLNAASAVVLPLQGVWNAVIYFITSWSIFRAEVSRAVLKVRAMYPWIRLSGSASSKTGTAAAAAATAVQGMCATGDRAARHDDLGKGLEPPRMNNVRALRGSF